MYYLSILSFDYNYLLVLFLIALPFLYEFSNKFRLILKFILYYIIVMIVSLSVIPIIIWRPGNTLNTIIATYPLNIINLVLGLHWNVRGVENATPDRAAIVVSNHQSSIDFLGMVHMWPMFRKITAIAKKELLYVQPFGLTAWLCGTRFINRSNPQKAKDSMNAALDYCKENKVKIWIFPEGTRCMKDEMLPFKKGAFHLAISGQIPILPVVYSSYRGFLSYPLKIFNPGNIIVHVLPAIETTGMTKDDMPQLMETVRAKMKEKFDEISSEVEQPFPLCKTANCANKL